MPAHMPLTPEEAVRGLRNLVMITLGRCLTQAEHFSVRPSTLAQLRSIEEQEQGSAAPLYTGPWGTVPAVSPHHRASE